MKDVYYKMMLDYFRIRIHSNIEILENYLVDTSSHLDNAKSSFLKKYNEQKAATSDEDIADIMEFYEDDYSMHTEFFPNLLYSSSLMSVFSFYEYSLKNMCDTFQKLLNETKSREDRNENGYVEKSIAYLENDLNLNLSKVSAQRDFLDNMRKLRNFIAHSDSNIWKNKNKKLNEQTLYSFVISEDSFSINEYGQVTIKGFEIVRKSLQSVKEVLVESIKGLSKK